MHTNSTYKLYVQILRIHWTEQVPLPISDYYTDVKMVPTPLNKCPFLATHQRHCIQRLVRRGRYLTKPFG